MTTAPGGRLGGQNWVKAEPVPRRKFNWQTRILLGFAFWLALAMGIPFYAKTSEWRWAIFVATGGLSATLALFLNPKATQKEPKKRVPKIAGHPGLIEELASKAIDRADRAMVGWLTIVGAGHSAVFAAFAGGARFFTEPGSRLGLTGAAFLILGVLCYAGNHAITSTKEQAIRALSVASKVEPAGAYFRYVYEDENKPPAVAGMLVPAIGSLGYVWFCLGILFVVIGYMIQALLA